jgi:tetratricopeptide (TPR) repeat protein
MSRWDIAISFAGEDRPTAQQLATDLKNRGLMVFYDDDEQAQLLGENLTEYLVDVYKNQANYCVVLVSQSYVRKRWTRHEWRAAQARAFEQMNKAYILPVRLDDAELPDLLPTVGYISLQHRSLAEAALIIWEKVRHSAEINQILKMAYVAYHKGDLERAQDLLDEVKSRGGVVRYPDLRLLADTNLALGRIEAAIEVYHVVTSRYPNDSDAWFLLGVCHFRIGRFRESIPYYERAVALGPHRQAYLDAKMARLLSRVEFIPFLRRLIVENVSATKALLRDQKKRASTQNEESNTF